jgi:chromate reductase, NAD(P)H dehydrogenase (quinone)
MSVVRPKGREHGHMLLEPAPRGASIATGTEPANGTDAAWTGASPPGPAEQRRARDHGAPIRVVGVSGSLRRGSLNRRLLQAAIDCAPEGVEVRRFGLDRVPLYDGDVEASGDPPAVARLKDAIREADAVLIATPEYNRSIPAVTKNAIDWASRPPFDAPLQGKPVALMGASTGRSGAAGGIEHARIALDASGAIVLPEVVRVPRASARFDAEGRLIDEETRRSLVALLEALRAAAHTQRTRTAA